MADNITYDTIPGNLPLGGVFLEIDPSQALGNLVNAERKVLIIGQRLPEGTTPAKTPVRVLSQADAEQKFGRGSMLHNMFGAVQAFIDETGLVDVYAVALDDNEAGVAAKATVTLGGQVVTPRTMKLYIGGKQIQIAASLNDTAAALATKLSAAINADKTLPVSAAAAEETRFRRGSHRRSGTKRLRSGARKYRLVATKLVDRLPAGSSTPEGRSTIRHWPRPSVAREYDAV